MLRQIFAIVFIILFSCSASAYDVKTLDNQKICEPSAALIVQCPDGGDCLLVGDNEKKKKLYLYSIDKSRSELTKIRGLSFRKLVQDFDGKKVSDIEALARISKKEFLAMASHSRNKYCEIKPRRRIFFHGKVGKKKIKAGSIAAYKTPGEGGIDCVGLFKGSEVQGDRHVARFCAAVLRSSEAADRAQDNQKQCAKDPAFNIEGAVYVKDASGKKRLWVGLRSPLVGGKAVLLRMIKSRDAFQFDAVAFVKTTKLGIRALERSGRTVWGISGTKSDSSSRHVLWKFDARELTHGKDISITSVARDLPNKSEGLAVKRNTAIVLIDGAEGKGQCRENGRYFFLNVSKD